MKAILDIIRGLLGLIILILFIFILTVTPTLLSFSTLITNRNTLINWLEQGDMHDQISKAAIKDITDDLGKEGGRKPDANTEAFKKQVTKTLSENFFEDNIKRVTDGTYDWLEGKTSSIEISTLGLDVVGMAKDFIPKEQLKNYEFMKFLNSVKPCTEAQAFNYEEQGGFKDLKDICIPPKFELLPVADEAYDATIGKQNLNLASAFQIPPIPHETAQQILTVYRVLDWLGAILSTSLLILLLLYLLIVPMKEAKVYIVASITFLTGLINLILWKGLLLKDLIGNFVTTNLNTKDLPFEISTVTNLTNIVFDDLARNGSHYSILIMLIGVLIAASPKVYQYFVSLKKK